MRIAQSRFIDRAEYQFAAGRRPAPARPSRTMSRATASIQASLLASGGELRRAFAPTRGQRVEDHEAQCNHSQRPERILAVAEEAELADHVYADDHDREPARPP